MLNSHQQIVKEIQRREILNNLIDSIIKSHCPRRAKRSIRRGIVHDIVCQTLGLINNFQMRRIINDRMEANGYRKKISQGYLYFEKLRK